MEKREIYRITLDYRNSYLLSQFELELAKIKASCPKEELLFEVELSHEMGVMEIVVFQPIASEEVQVDIPDQIFLTMAKNAHKLDITFNEYVNQYIKGYIEEEKYGSRR